MFKWFVVILLGLLNVGCRDAHSGSGWSDDYIQNLSKGDCKGIASGDKTIVPLEIVKE